MRNPRRHGDQVSSSHTARPIAFGQKQQFPVGDVGGLLVRVRMVRIGLRPGAVVDIKDHGHQLAGIENAPLESGAKAFALGLIE